MRLDRLRRCGPPLLIVVLAGCADVSPPTVGSLLNGPATVRLSVESPGGLGAPRTVAAWSFEPDVPNSWKVRRSRGQGTGDLSVERSRNGEGAYLLEAAGDGADMHCQVHVPVRPNTRYRLEGHLWAEDLEVVDADVSGTLYLGEFSYRPAGRFDHNDPLRWHRTLPSVSGRSEGWESVVYEFKTLSRTRSLRIAASLGNWGRAKGALYVDDVRLVELPDETSVEGDLPVLSVDFAGHVRRSIRTMPGTVFESDVQIGEGTRLRFGLGVDWQMPGSIGSPLRFRIDMVDGAEIQEIFSESVRPEAEESSTWSDRVVDLERFQGRDVTLRFVTEGLASEAVVNPGGEGVDTGGYWAEPRIAGSDGSDDRPNVVLITIDTLRPDHLGCYGYARPTSPHLDALASDAVVFENTYTTVPRTAPAIASMMTGLYPRSHALRTLVDTLDVGTTTLAERLRDAGYTTGAVVTYNVSRRYSLDQGFDFFADHMDPAVNDIRARADRLIVPAMDWLDHHGDSRFFFWLHAWDPHFFYEPPDSIASQFTAGDDVDFDLYDRIGSEDLKLGDVYFRNDLSPAEVDHAVDLYDGEIRFTDQVVGDFLGRLSERGLFEDALIVVASDHGESLGDHGYFFEHGEYLYESTLRIPLVIRYPNGDHGGRRIDGLASILDVVPTLMEAVGSPVPSEEVHGQVLDPEKVPEADRVLFVETGRNFFEENPRRPVAGVEGHWVGAVSEGWKFLRIPTPMGQDRELYDLAADPEEVDNRLASDPVIAKRLEGLMDAWIGGFDDTESSDRNPGLDGDTQRHLRSLGYMD